MIRFDVKPVNTLSDAEQSSIMHFLDSCAGASAYQFPYSAQGNELLFLMERDGELRFCGRSSTGFAMSKYLPFLKVLAFNRGPVAATCEDMLEGMHQLVHWARKRWYLEIKIAPWLPFGQGQELATALAAQAWVFADNRRQTLRIGISQPLEAVFAGLPKDCRYMIRRAGREGITVVVADTHEQLAAFIAMYQAMTARKGLAQTHPDLFSALWQLRLQDPARVCLLMAKHEGRTLGGNLLFRFGECAEYLYGAVDRNNPLLRGDVTAGYPLQWAGMQWAKANRVLYPIMSRVAGIMHRHRVGRIERARPAG